MTSLITLLTLMKYRRLLWVGRLGLIGMRKQEMRTKFYNNYLFENVDS